ncbi:tautomerase family protein [Candidatus Nephthysia bennettiae]|uniref:Tautomerase family protein n=1 Tax=Candidatus Nephthysia bennettiae TaxID=3127016 RepID=A0A934NA71_9BACT|nr:tautomerase family protein [Candidatus Dormibacteraeota bacterium]MBJ7614027.1 tautomerase family protein [Candidatus Dormibacteraeota bacterium]
MPFITVEILKGRSLDQRRKFANLVTEAAVATLDTSPERVRIVFRELDPTELARAGVLVADQQGVTSA